MPLSCSELDLAEERCIELEEGVGGKEGETAMIKMTMSQLAAAPQLNVMSMFLLLCSCNSLLWLVVMFSGFLKSRMTYMGFCLVKIKGGQ